MAKKKSPGRGGAREGAGRKPTNPEGATKVVAVTVPIELIGKLDAWAKGKELNRSQAITESIRKLLARSRK